MATTNIPISLESKTSKTKTVKPSSSTDNKKYAFIPYLDDIPNPIELHPGEIKKFPIDSVVASDAFRIQKYYTSNNYIDLTVSKEEEVIMSGVGAPITQNILKIQADDDSATGKTIYDLSLNPSNKDFTKKYYPFNKIPLSITVKAPVYGFKINKYEPNPNYAVEYIYDAEGMKPAHMNFVDNYFDYGDWENVWFVKNNHAVVLNHDGVRGGEINQYDYSDITYSAGESADTTEIMSFIPEIYIKRYDDGNYLYNIISSERYDDDFYAIYKGGFYWSVYGASLGTDSTFPIRSISGATRYSNFTVDKIWQMFPIVNYTNSQHPGWSQHTFAGRQIITSLLILMGKSLNAQQVFGNGNTPGSTNALTTGTLDFHGPFFGYNTNNQQVKVFCIEGFWGDLWDYTYGIYVDSGGLLMISDGAGIAYGGASSYMNYTAASGTYIKTLTILPRAGFLISNHTGGSATTYTTDGFWVSKADRLIYQSRMGGGSDQTNQCGFFTYACNVADTKGTASVGTATGCGLQYYYGTVASSYDLPPD